MDLLAYWTGCVPSLISIRQVQPKLNPLVRTSAFLFGGQQRLGWNLLPFSSDCDLVRSTFYLPPGRGCCFGWCLKFQVSSCLSTVIFCALSFFDGLKEFKKVTALSYLPMTFNANKLVCFQVVQIHLFLNKPLPQGSICTSTVKKYQNEGWHLHSVTLFAVHHSPRSTSL